MRDDSVFFLNEQAIVSSRGIRCFNWDVDTKDIGSWRREEPSELVHQTQREKSEF